MKTCRKCNIEKPLSDYYKHVATFDGKFSMCKTCANALSKARYEKLKEDPEKFQAERDKYNAQKRQKLKEIKKKFGKR